MTKNRTCEICSGSGVILVEFSFGMQEQDCDCQWDDGHEARPKVMKLNGSNDNHCRDCDGPIHYDMFEGWSHV